MKEENELCENFSSFISILNEKCQGFLHLGQPYLFKLNGSVHNVPNIYHHTHQYNVVLCSIFNQSTTNIFLLQVIIAVLIYKAQKSLQLACSIAQISKQRPWHRCALTS
jgi:hypothetical protein